MAKKEFDVIVIGGGSAGLSAAERAMSLGSRVALIEEGPLGGECPNWACVPTKALLHEAKAYHTAKKTLGQRVTHRSAVKAYKSIQQAKEDVVDTITGQGKRYAKGLKDSGITHVMGRAVFTSAHEVAVGKAIYRAKAFVLATGARTFIPPVEGIDSAPFLTFKDAVSLQTLPSSIVIVGAGPVGCEFASFFAYLGVRVSLIQIEPRVLPREEPEVSAIVKGELEALGVQVLTESKALAVRQAHRGVEVTYQREGFPRKTVAVSHVLFAAGKRANVEGLGLEKMGVKLDEKGRLLVKDTQQTSVPHILAAGDVAGGYQFTHVAHVEGAIAGANAHAVAKRSTKRSKLDVRVVPRVTFTPMEAASVGETSSGLTARGASFVTGLFRTGGLGRSVTEGVRTGVLLVHIDKKTLQILGAHMAAPRAGEVMHELAVAMKAGIPAPTVLTTIHAFPTYSEAVPVALSEALAKLR